MGESHSSSLPVVSQIRRRRLARLGGAGGVAEKDKGQGEGQGQQKDATPSGSQASATNITQTPTRPSLSSEGSKYTLKR